MLLCYSTFSQTYSKFILTSVVQNQSDSNVRAVDQAAAILWLQPVGQQGISVGLSLELKLLACDREICFPATAKIQHDMWRLFMLVRIGYPCLMRMIDFVAVAIKHVDPQIATQSTWPLQRITSNLHCNPLEATASTSNMWTCSLTVSGFV